MEEPRTSYDPQYFEPLFEVEDRHFWFRTRSRMITGLAKSLTGRLDPGYRVLEIGCGTGSVLKALAAACQGGTVIGMDLFAEGLRFASRRVNTPLVQGDMDWPPFAGDFDLIGMFDVLEHLKDDLGVLDRLGQMLKDGGHLLITVPARQSLWSYFDIASHHVRRYELLELDKKLRESGFEVEFLSPYFMAVFPFVWFGRRLVVLANRQNGVQERTIQELSTRELRVIPILNEAAAFLLSLETSQVLKKRRLPFGTSLVAVCRKQSKPR